MRRPSKIFYYMEFHVMRRMESIINTEITHATKITFSDQLD